jgi:hypothetical protein
MATKIVIKILPKAKIDPDKWPVKLRAQLLDYGDTKARLRKRIKKVLPDVQPALDKGAKLRILAIPDNQLIGYEFFSPPGKNVKDLLTKIKREGTRIKAFIPCQGTEEDADIQDEKLEETILEGAEDAADGEENEAQQQAQHQDTTAGQEADAANLAAVFKQRLQAFRPSFDTALPQARANNPELAEELDGLFAQMFDESKLKKFEMALQTLDTLTKRVTNALPGPTPPAEEMAAALERPDTEPDVDEAPLPQDVVAGTSAKPAANEKAVQWKERDAKFVPHLKAFLHAGTGDIAGVTKLYKGATDAAGDGTYDVANRILDKLEPLVVKGAVTGMVGWQKAKIETITQIRQLQTALAKTKQPGALRVAKRLESIPTRLQTHPDSDENRKVLETYVTTDDTITRAEKPNLWGIKIVIREPLMKALAGLMK